MRHENFEHKPSGPSPTERAAATGPRNGSEAVFEASKLHNQQYSETNLNESLIGSGLDHPLALTIFTDVYATRAERHVASLRELATIIAQTKGVRKDKLPLLKLASFGEKRRPQKTGENGKCLRWDENMLSVSGIEGDYDAGKVPMEVAAEKLARAGIAALMYTSTHHTPQEPRWRVLCPLMSDVTRDDRAALCAKLNGALGGILADESFTASQAYYFGETEFRDQKHGGGLAYPLQHILVEGRTLDQAQDWELNYGPTPQGDKEKTQKSRQGKGKTGKPLRLLLSALQSIPNDATIPSDWHHFNRIGMALHEETLGSLDGLNIFDKWCRQHPSYDQAECLSRWQSYRAGVSGNIGGGTIFALAKQNGWTESSSKVLPAEDMLESTDDNRRQPRLRALSTSERASGPKRKHLIKGMLSEGDIACVFGPPGAGKSLLLPFISHTFARGGDIFGMRTSPANVLYLAAEDEAGMRGRLTALDIAHGDAEGLYLVEADGGIDLLSSQSNDLYELRHLSKDRNAKLIVIDTLAMAFPGLEENTAEGMGRVVAVAKALSTEGAAVILVHHDTKAEGNTPRGHSLLNGALDVAIHVRREAGGRIKGTFTKNRNGTCDRELNFRIALEQLGEDDDGDAIILPRCEPITSPALNQRLSGPEQAVVGLLQRHGGTLLELQLRKLCVEEPKVSNSDAVESRKKAASRAIKSLIEKGLILLEAGEYRLDKSDMS